MLPDISYIVKKGETNDREYTEQRTYIDIVFINQLGIKSLFRNYFLANKPDSRNSQQKKSKKKSKDKKNAFLYLRRCTRPTSPEFLLQDQPLTEGTSLPNPRTPSHQSKRNRNASQTNKPKEGSSPRNPERVIERLSSQREKCASNTPHNNGSCQCASRVDFVCIGHVGKKRNEDGLESEPENKP